MAKKKSNQIPNSTSPNLPLILAIDTSCDDTSAAITQGYQILSNVIASQANLHVQYGGVFPTLAKQQHAIKIKPVVALALKRAGVSVDQIQAVAVTLGPGLAPALEIGITFAKEFAQQHQIPLLAVNHIEGHAVSALAQPKSPLVETLYPALAVVISGGHSEFILVSQEGMYQRLGWTVDDAAGEAMDKVGRLLDLGYPAGPVMEKMAKLGDSSKYAFPLPMTASGDLNLSFSGLKTSANNLLTKIKNENAKANNSLNPGGNLTKQQTYDFGASFQQAIIRHITHKLNKALEQYPVKEIWLGGGVAANLPLRKAIRQLAKKHRLVSYRIPYTKKLCADNAAMIGVAAHLNFHQKQIEFLQADRKPNWRLDMPLPTKLQ